MSHPLSILEMTIAQARAALSNGSTTAVELVARHLERVGYYDRQGLGLNAIPILNPHMFAEAAESDRRYQEGGTAVRPLEGIPFTVKDSYMVKGLTVASGSPAFVNLVASADAFTVARLREAGAVLIGKTTMPPMAAGGMQRGAYGRSESAYNTEFLPAAYASGSSNGSGTATATSMAVFGMAEETFSSGRSPASNNAICAYTPSRGLLSMRGNWPLFPAWDVVVPHTRTVEDLLALLDVLMVSDPETRGDFWRQQTVLKLPSPEDVRPSTFTEVAKRWNGKRPLDGKRFGVPRMYIGQDPESDIEVRPSILKLWKSARNKLTELGATVVECDFPVLKRYEGRNPTGDDLEASGIVPGGWMGLEFKNFMWWAWDDFLRSNAELAAESGLPHPEPALLSDVHGDLIFPLPPGSLPDRYNAKSSGALDPAAQKRGCRYQDVPAQARAGLASPAQSPRFAEALRAIESLRLEGYEAWLEQENLDGLVFPANADVGAADADIHAASADSAWKNGVLYSNGNLVIRHLGIPTVTVPMGIMQDTSMPVGLTFAGPAYRDTEILGWAYAFDTAASLRVPPGLTPPLPGDMLPPRRARSLHLPALVTVAADIRVLAPHKAWHVHAHGDVSGLGAGSVRVTINGIQVPVIIEAERWRAEAVLPAPVTHESSILPPNAIVVVTAVTESGATSAVYCEVDNFSCQLIVGEDLDSIPIAAMARTR